MSIQERKAREFNRRESEILNAALALFGRADWELVTVEEISRKAEVGKGTIYKHFESKDEIYARLALEFNRKLLAQILAATRGQPLLVVSDSHEAHALGSTINFVMVDQRLRFEVALKPATDNGLKLSALMLTAAYHVTREGP